MGDLKGVEVGSFSEDSAAFMVLLGLLALKHFLDELPCEVGMFFPPRLICFLLLVIQEFGIEQATGLHLVHKVVYLVVIGDCDPMVFALDLAPVQLAHKVGDMRFWSVTPWRK